MIGDLNCKCVAEIILTDE